MSTVCLIDAQQDFWDTAGKVENQLKSVLWQALRLGDDLVVVEYAHNGPTHHSLRCIIDKFPQHRVAKVTKYADGGGKRVLKAIRSMRLDESLVRVCGVNRCYCVFDTVAEMRAPLSRFNGRIELIERAVACHDYCCSSATNVSKRLMRYRDMGVTIN
jgi:hypothetical protein